MCNHDWVPDIDLGTGEIRAWSCARCPESRPEAGGGNP